MMMLHGFAGLFLPFTVEAFRRLARPTTVSTQAVLKAVPATSVSAPPGLVDGKTIRTINQALEKRVTDARTVRGGVNRAMTVRLVPNLGAHA